MIKLLARNDGAQKRLDEMIAGGKAHNRSWLDFIVKVTSKENLGGYCIESQFGRIGEQFGSEWDIGSGLGQMINCAGINNEGTAIQKLNAKLSGK
jgi:hypothetical protein